MLFPEIPLEELLDKGCWEIIDGQQRLTSLYLLYKYLMLKKGWSEEDLKEEEDGKALYHLVYATREESSKFLERLGLDALNAEKDDANTDTNIDHYHMMVAFKTIDTWLKSTGKEINERYHLSKSLEEVRNPIFRLLNGMRDTKTGSVQVLWYELDEATDSSIREFQKINTGKLRLTDAELVKGLFLQSRNFANGTNYIDQTILATEWELIENTLHADNFWYFLQRKGQDMPNRMRALKKLPNLNFALSNG